VRLSDRARDLRRNATKEERIVWRWLRDRRLRGLKFRRQHPILNYVADFYCVELKLIVEIDGRGHETPAEQHYDVRRACELSKIGVEIIRVRNEDVRKDSTATADTVIAAIERLRSEYQPSPGLRPPSPASGRGR
jgi:very-short-patch-repair endonuclease